MTERFAIGVDFGGTKVLAGLVNLETGDVVSSAKKRTQSTDGPDELMARLTDTIESAIDSFGLNKKSRPIGIGVGIAGQVDRAEGILLGAPNLSQATVNLPMAKLLKDKFSMPAALRNDVQIAAMGEAAFGSGKDCPDFLCVFVGTGIGGAIVRDGVLVEGATGTAGEIGHLVIDANGRICGCGGRGHLEAYASRTAITKALIAELQRGRDSLLQELAPDLKEDEPGGGAIRSGVLAKAIARQDQLVTETIIEAGQYLGLGLASAVNLLNPTRIILGGGVIEAVDLLLEVAARRTRREALATPAKRIEIVKAKLGDYSGVVGAAILGAQAAGNR